MSFSLRKIFLLTFFMQLICCIYVPVIAQDRHDASKNIEFVENKNQWDSRVLYKADIVGGAIFLEKNCFTFAFEDMKQIDKLLAFKHVPVNERPVITDADFYINWHAYKINFINSRQDVKVSASTPFEGYYNYFSGNDKRKWASKVNSYAAVSYNGIYANTDIKVYENNYNLNYDIILHPGADIDEIKLQYKGANKVILRGGDLIIKTSVNEVSELSPEAYQMKGSVKVKIPCKFELEDNVLTFVFPSGYDKGKDIIIDPVLIFSTYSGSYVDNWGFTATYDDKGEVYSGGIAFGTGYPVTVGAYQVNFAGGTGYNYNGCDIAIIKYDSSGTHRLFATYLGGSEEDIPSSMIVDNSNELVIYGMTGSSDFPITHGTFQQTFNGGDSIVYDHVLKFAHGIDIFVAKLSSDGSQLLASTFVGGTGNDGLNYPSPLSINYADGARGEVMIDASDNVYVTSATKSTDFPVTAGAFQTTSGGGEDGVVFKMDASLSTMIWSSYIGGSGTDDAYAMVLDNNNNVYVTGGTNSTINFPTTLGTLHTKYMGGYSDGFISEISQDGSTLMKSTYYGSSAYDQSYLIQRDKSGYIYVYGQTSDTSNAFIYNALWNKPHGGQFISKITPDLSTLVWSTTFGTGKASPPTDTTIFGNWNWQPVFGIGKGCPDISPTAFLVDVCNNIYISGWGGPVISGFGGTKGLPITANAYQNTTTGSDYYFLVINNNASSMVYATYFGSPDSTDSWAHVDGGTSRFDRKGLIYQGVCGGCGASSSFPTTPGAWSQKNNSDNCNNAVIKFDFGLPLAAADFFVPPAVCDSDNVSFLNTSHSVSSTGVYFNWTFGDGSSSNLFSPSHAYIQSGVYNVTLVITDSGSCNISDTISKQLIVLNNFLKGSLDTLPSKYICNGGSTQIGLIPQSGSSMTYQWTPASTLNYDNIANPVADPATSTNYVLFVSNGTCNDTVRQTVIVSNLTLAAGPDTLICPGSSVKLSAVSTGGATSYIWSTTPLIKDTLNYPLTNNSATVTPTVPSTYYVQVSSQYCSKLDSVHVGFITLNATPTVLTEPSCNGLCNGQITLSISGGTPPYTYSWNNGQYSGNTITNICAGKYYVLIEDSKGCKNVDTFLLKNPDTLKVNINHLKVLCYDSCKGAASAAAFGGTPAYSYEWSNGNNGNTVMYLCPGTYYVTATDNHLCKTVDTVTISASALTPPSINAYADKKEIYVTQSSGLHVTVMPGYTYSWSPSAGLNNPSIPNPVATPSVTTTYFVTIKDQYGCTLLDTVTIDVIEVPCNASEIFVPNAFTPNSDNNSILYVKSNVLKSIYFVIYNRWGEKVFETYDASAGWDGTFRGKACDPGVFDYYMKATCINDKEFIKKGNITLIR
jgi:gliding motility-associated-like protein